MKAFNQLKQSASRKICRSYVKSYRIYCPKCDDWTDHYGNTRSRYFKCDICGLKEEAGK